MFVDWTYELDNERREIRYSRSFRGIDQTWRICRFDEVRQVGLTAERHQRKGHVWYTYAVVLELPNGVRVQISDDTSDFDAAGGFASSLADHLGAQLVTPRPQISTMSVDDWNLPMVPSTTDWRTVPLVGRASFWWVLFFVVTVLLNMMAFGH